MIVETKCINCGGKRTIDSEFYDLLYHPCSICQGKMVIEGFFDMVTGEPIDTVTGYLAGEESKLTTPVNPTGMKFDDGKLRWDLLPYDVIEDVVDILTFGAQKYAPNNWKGVEIERYQAAMMRHFSAYMQGEMNDPESGKHHLAHVITNAVFMLWKEKRKGD